MTVVRRNRKWKGRDTSEMGPLDRVPSSGKENDLIAVWSMPMANT